MDKRTVSLVLGAGGARGYAHIGVINWLVDNGYDIRSIAGSSMADNDGFAEIGDPFGEGTIGLLEAYAPDIALLPIGGWFTMGPAHAARAARMLGVETVIPIHYGTFPILAGTPAELEEHAGRDFEVVAVEIGVPVS